MKKSISIFLCVLFLLNLITLTSCKKDNPTTEAYVGMSRSELSTLLTDTQYLSIVGYFFYKDSNGNDVVVYEHHERVEEVSVFEGRTENPTKKQFKKLKPYMSIAEMVELVGLPQIIAGSGVIILGYETEDGEPVSVCLGANPNGHGYLVYEINM